MALTEFQALALERFLAGDKTVSRWTVMFCFDERSKYVHVWDSDRTTVLPESTSNALFDRGYFYAGSVTDAGKAALAKYRAKHPRTTTAQKPEPSTATK